MNYPPDKLDLVSQIEECRRILSWERRVQAYQRLIKSQKAKIDAEIKALQSNRAMNRLEKLVKIRDLRKQRGNL